MTVSSPPSAERFLKSERLRAKAAMPMAVVVAVLAGVLVAKLSLRTHPVQALLLPVLAIPFILWKWPRVGVYIVMAAAVTVEQFEYMITPNKRGTLTSWIPFFHSISSGSGVTPAEMLLFVAVVLWVLKTVRDGQQLLPRSPTALFLGIFLLIVLLYLMYGLAHGGRYKIAIWEIRPWFYLGILFVLAAQLMTTRRAVRTLLWIFVLGCPPKALYGVILWFQTRNMHPRPEAVLAHEESFFFGVYLLLVLALWLFDIRGRLRVVATVLSPIVLLADMTNSRRTAWAILGFGVVALLSISYVQLRHRRKILLRALAIGMVLAPVYLPLYWNKDGTIAQPARALRSEIKPDSRDLSSNQFRVTENYDLQFDIRSQRDLGDGFGLPINYVIPEADITNIDPDIAFIPHDGVFYVWMRTGFVGEFVLWCFIAAGLVRCCRLVRLGDPESSMFGAVAACAIVSYVTMAYLDMGFSWFRLAFAVGIFLGTVEARLRVVGKVRDPAPGHRNSFLTAVARPMRTSTIRPLPEMVPVAEPSLRGWSGGWGVSTGEAIAQQAHLRPHRSPEVEGAAPAVVGGADGLAPAASRLGRNISALSISQLAGWTSGLLATVVIPRFLGPEALGVLVAAYAVAGALGLMFALLSGPYLVREMVARPDDVATITGTAMAIRLLMVPLFLGAIVGLRPCCSSRRGTAAGVLPDRLGRRRQRDGRPYPGGVSGEGAHGLPGHHQRDHAIRRTGSGRRGRGAAGVQGGGRGRRGGGYGTGQSLAQPSLGALLFIDRSPCRSTRGWRCCSGAAFRTGRRE